MNVLSFKGKIPNTKHFVTAINVRYWDWSMTYRAQCVHADDPAVLAVFEKHDIPRYDPETDAIMKEKSDVQEEKQAAVKVEEKQQKEVVDEQPVREVEAVEDWRSMPWFKMRSLASSKTDEPIRNKEDAVRVLAAHFGEGDIEQ